MKGLDPKQEEISQNDLDDIVLEQYEKKEKLKRTLLLVGTGVLVFLLVLGIIKFFIDSSSAPQESLVEEKVATQQSDEMEDEFEEVPILSDQNQEPQESDEDLNKIVQDVLKKKESLKQKETPTPPSPAPSIKKSEKIKKVAEVKKQTQSTKKEKKKQHNHNKVKATKSYYIQVGAFSKYPPDKAFLRKIESAGYRYTIKRVVINGKKINKVLIGPFQSKQKARKLLSKIKQKIVSGAFIVRL